MKSREKQLIYWIVGGGTCLFLAGAAFCYFILLKITMLVSVSFAHMLGFGADEWRADNLIGFVAKFTIGMGLAFQMPMVILSLVKIGFVDDRGLAKFRSYAVVINLILAAMITPTVDPFTMLLVAGPLQFLYEISLFVARYWRRRDEAAEPLGLVCPDDRDVSLQAAAHGVQGGEGGGVVGSTAQAVSRALPGPGRLLFGYALVVGPASSGCLCAGSVGVDRSVSGTSQDFLSQAIPSSGAVVQRAM